MLASADALLVVMSFDKDDELFMRTSSGQNSWITHIWETCDPMGAQYSTPVRVAKKRGGAAVVSTGDADAVVSVCRQIAADPELSRKLSDEALQLHQTLFNPDGLQEIFVQKITELVNGTD